MPQNHHDSSYVGQIGIPGNGWFDPHSNIHIRHEEENPNPYASFDPGRREAAYRPWRHGPDVWHKRNRAFLGQINLTQSR